MLLPQSLDFLAVREKVIAKERVDLGKIEEQYCIHDLRHFQPQQPLNRKTTKPHLRIVDLYQNKRPSSQ